MADDIFARSANPSSPAGAVAAVPSNPPPRRPSLLPAFEPFSSSSPGLPRQLKRKLDDVYDDRKHYPTPVPTSSTAIIPSSSPPSRRTRPSIQRSVSTLSERAPLGDVPTLTFPDNGEPLLLGRSSNSSDYQLPGNRQISRVHVRACHLPATNSHPAGVVEVQCLGWNGIKVHCRGEIVELAKGEVYRSDLVAPIMVDVQDTRVMLLWPKRASLREVVEDGTAGTGGAEGSPWPEESPSKRRHVSVEEGENVLASSPPPLLPRLRSPVSPTPAALAGSAGQTFVSTFRAVTPDDGEVKVYEDHSSDEDAPHDPTPEPDEAASSTPAVSATPNGTKQAPKPTEAAAAAAAEVEEFSEHDEENDPVVHAMGPFGENILSRLQSFQPSSPEGKRQPLTKKPSFSNPHRSPSLSNASVTPGPTTSNSNSTGTSGRMQASPIKNHVINQLAFSRVHSLPLSQIHSNLPAELRGAMVKPSDTENRHVLTTSELKTMLDGIPCVGEIAREGKDAHGKLLESEFYYVPEMDGDQMRRETVTMSLGKTSIRAARKSHKVCSVPLFSLLSGLRGRALGLVGGCVLCSRLIGVVCAAILLETTAVICRRRRHCRRHRRHRRHASLPHPCLSLSLSSLPLSYRHLSLLCASCCRISNPTSSRFSLSPFFLPFVLLRFRVSCLLHSVHAVSSTAERPGVLSGKGDLQ